MFSLLEGCEWDGETMGVELWTRLASLALKQKEYAMVRGTCGCMCTLVPPVGVCMYITRFSPMHFHLLGQFLFAYCKLLATRAGSDFIQPCVGILYVYGYICVCVVYIVCIWLYVCVFVCACVCVGILYV